MSATTKLHELSAQAWQRAKDLREQAAERLSAHEESTVQKASQLAEMEAAYIANATAEALGEAPTTDAPDPQLLQKLRADAAVAEPVRLQLVANLAKHDEAVQAAEAKHRESVAEYLRESAVAPALGELQQAFSQLRDATVNVMAAHNLAYRRFGKQETWARDPHGPISSWLDELRSLSFADSHYDFRPNWLNKHGSFAARDLPGVAERTAELLAEVEQVPA